jgi:hypothetical protein
MNHGDELVERCAAELEFVSAAYDPKEAWCTSSNDGNCSVERRLVLPLDGDANITTTDTSIILALKMPRGYPCHESLDISATVEESSGNMKSAWDALPSLLEACRDEAASIRGSEAVLTVLSRADEWIQDEWPNLCTQYQTTLKAQNLQEDTDSCSTQRLGRRLIYSHHLISKVKRADIKDLASHYELTGYMKIGWPGIIIIEGLEENCISFYDDIRGWAWKYLVVRGEQLEQGVKNRKFASFLETDDMSVVADHCRKVGLEVLFKTTMKVYDTQDTQGQEEEALYGSLVIIDHTNDGKHYRKWLRKTARQLDCLVFVRQCYLDYTKRPLIVVGVVGATVSEFMKRWRTSRVDVDSKGRPCFERQMTVLTDGLVNSSKVEMLEWDRLQTEDTLNVSLEQLRNLIHAVGGTDWSDAFEEFIQVGT